jgi:hypothetical protein
VRVDTSSVDSNAHAFELAQERGLKANLKTEAMIELLLDSPPFVFSFFCLAQLSSTSPAHIPLGALRVIAPRQPAPPVDNSQPGRVCTRQVL